MSAPVYVSITGLRLKRWWHIVPFVWHATRSARQARRAPGNLRVELLKADGVYHTMTVWRSQADMRRFIYAGAHMQAIRAFATFATGRTFGFEAAEAPALADVPALWRAHGRAYGAAAEQPAAQTTS